MASIPCKKHFNNTNNSANPAILGGIGKLQTILAKSNLCYDDSNELYNAGVQICAFVCAKERRIVWDKLQMESMQNA